MKAVALNGIREFKQIDKENPTISNPDDVLIQIKSVGICGSDIHYYNEGNIGNQVVEYPFVIGHEAAGIVIATGRNVKNVKPGDHIAIEPTIWCGECEQCKQGRKHTCLNQKFLGCPGQIEGCLSELYLLPEHCCYKVNNKLPYELAVFAEPLSVGLYATELFGKLSKQSKVGILGSGPIGLSVLSSCIKADVNHTFITDKNGYRLNVAKQLGAFWTGYPTDNYKSNSFDLTPNSLDVVFECCGKQEAVDQAIELLKPGGTIMMIGIPEVDSITFKIDTMRRKEISFINVRRQNECFQKAIDMIEADQEFFAPLITHKLDFNNVAKGFELVRTYSDNVIKAVIEP